MSERGGHVLVLCEEYDHAAVWAADRLRARGWDVDLMAGAALAAAGQWEHRVGAGGNTISIRLADGRRIGSDAPIPVLNRLSYLPGALLHRLGGPDRDYALQEWYALYLSWLHALPGPVVNRAVPAGLCGAWRHPSQWTQLSARAGLPVRPYRQSHRDDPMIAMAAAMAPAPLTAFVAGGRVVAPTLAVALHAPCRALARMAGVVLLGIDFAPAPGGGSWEFIGASVTPNLISGGEPLIDALAAALAPHRRYAPAPTASLAAELQATA